MVEPEIKDFLKRVVWTVSLVFLWLMLTLGIGAYNALLVPEKGVTIGHIIFYIWFAGSTGTLIWMILRIWRKKFPHG
ncbi:MAG TPA: hypothetical protein VFS22_03690 [Flavisolibacter sp.]|jgi:hypothetical protein|nr:hypothetical protein [Flavisolibacter sp.]